MVSDIGEFSIRGDIIDFYSLDKHPTRIELWGDEIDSIRNFNISSQRSLGTLEKVQIYPAHEYVLESNIEDIIGKIRGKIIEGKQEEILEQDLEQIKAG